MGERISSVRLDDVLVAAMPRLAQLWPSALESLAEGHLPYPGDLTAVVSIDRIGGRSELQHMLVCPALRRQVQKKIDYFGSVNSYSIEYRVYEAAGTVCGTCARRAVNSPVVAHVLMLGWFARTVQRIASSWRELDSAKDMGNFTRLSEVGKQIEIARSELASARAWATHGNDPDAPGALDALEVLLTTESEQLASALSDAGVSAGQLNAQRCTVVLATLSVASLSWRMRVAERRGDANVIRGEKRNWGYALLSAVSELANRRGRSPSAAAVDSTQFVSSLMDEALRATVAEALAVGPETFDQIPPVLHDRDGDVSVADWMRAQWEHTMQTHLCAIAAEVGTALIRVLDNPAPLYRLKLAGESDFNLNRWLVTFEVTAGPNRALTGALVPAALAQAALFTAARRPKMGVTAQVADPRFDQMHTMVAAMSDDLTSETLLWTDRYQAAADACGIELDPAVDAAFPNQQAWPAT